MVDRNNVITKNRRGPIGVTLESASDATTPSQQPKRVTSLGFMQSVLSQLDVVQKSFDRKEYLDTLVRLSDAFQERIDRENEEIAKEYHGG